MGVRRVFCLGCVEAERCATANHCAYFCGVCGRVRFPNVALSLVDEDVRLRVREEQLLKKIDRPTALDRASTLQDRTVTFVIDVLVWDVKKARLERGSPLRSTFTNVLVATELGIVGSGCSSSVGPYSAAATRGEQLPSLDARLVADGDACLSELNVAQRETVDAITEDGHGLSDCAVVLVPGQPPRDLSLATRLGLQLAKAGQRRDWFRKIAERDSRGALLGANELGTQRLNSAADAWFRARDQREASRSVAQNAVV